MENNTLVMCCVPGAGFSVDAVVHAVIQAWSEARHVGYAAGHVGYRLCSHGIVEAEGWVSVHDGHRHDKDHKIQAAHLVCLLMVVV